MNKLQHFIKINEISNDTLNGLLLKAIFFAQNQSFGDKKPENIVASIFMEPSTRTELSFKLACTRLGFTHLDFFMDRSSSTKGEHFLDTLSTLEAMGVGAAIIRTKDEDFFESIQNHTKIKLINAGSGTSHHPSQALLDLVTIKQELGRTDKLKIGIIGDTLHSRVANSTIDLHQKLGNELFLCSPSYFKSPRTGLGICELSIDETLKNADVIMMLRVQFERHHGVKITYQDYLAEFGLTAERLKLIRKDSIILHPGPFNRGIEIEGEVLKDSRVKIFKQVENAVPTRMAILDQLFKGASC